MLLKCFFFNFQVNENWHFADNLFYAQHVVVVNTEAFPSSMLWLRDIPSEIHHFLEDFVGLRNIFLYLYT